MENLQTGFTHYEQIIIDNIDFDCYDLENEPKTLFDKIKKVEEIFISEYGWYLQRMSKEKAFKEYLMGLPSVLTVPFYYHDILKHAEPYFHRIGMSKRAKSQQRYLDTYWERLSIAFWTLRDNL